MQEIEERLFALKDEAFKKFHAKLIPNVDEGIVIGVRTPELRKLAKEIKKTGLSEQFLKELPHRYYEENQLHSFVISSIKDYDECIGEIEIFLPYIDNWATCDQLIPKVLGKRPEDLLLKIKEWLASDRTYTIRFAIKMLMTFYLEDNFQEEYLGLVADVKSDEYYVKMMQAWFFATALAKRYEVSVVYLENRSLPEWVHKKTIQKARESYRITAEQKEYLKTLRWGYRFND